MKKHRVLLLDADGVLVLPPKMFSEVYCETYGIDAEKQQQFYGTREFKQAILGKFDLVQAIKTHNDLWQWEGDFNDLVSMWLEAENYPNQALVNLVDEFRKQGLPMYLATQQERYRAEYLKETMFGNNLDGIFCSCDIHADKHDKRFWEVVIQSLGSTYKDIAPSEIAFFDDKQTIVDVAKECGLDAYLYTKVSDVESVISI